MQQVARKRISQGNTQAYWLGQKDVSARAASCSGSGTGFNNDPSLDPKFYNQNWMKSIPDETPVSAIPIPGTHDSSSFHWLLPKRIKFDEVLKIIFKFLNAHGSETVLLKVTLHGNSKKKMVGLMDKVVKNFKDKIWTEWEVPNMNQARGKIVFLRSETYHIYDFVGQHKKMSLNQGCLGVFSMDFPSADLIKAIIQIKPCKCGSGGRLGEGEGEG
ncbi:uncharacterized protein LOC117828326 [Notolabrus celidotus]|uniref:uncharacterized protein LOC117828326 n=1 Tax=Notolabrus celidotus TaxID=1203425 RepID=UPI00148F4C9E|nr:uncharacterized protein LOC117828326 [Notolabrus celidotus]